jgi:SWI/SNF-related matrix-associated actin-dependent regulator 1 of chromatin subfamily A
MSLLADSMPQGGILRQMIGVAKAPSIVKLVIDEFQDGLDKILIFAWHTSVIEILRKGLADYNPVVINGATPIKDRHDLVTQFQTDPNCRVFIGNIIAAGEGITLTASNHVLFAEQSWVPKDNIQAAKRAHRIGQDKPVFVRFASFAGTIDDLITRAVARKTAMIQELLGDTT